MDIRRIARAIPRRPLAILTAGLVAGLVAWAPVLATVSWSAPTVASANGAYPSEGRSLARTVTSGGTVKLHQVYTKYAFNGVAAKDGGPYQGVYYRRGNSTGTSWGTAKRLNGTTTHAATPAIATAGKYVYAAWRTELHAGAAYDPADARWLQFRRNVHYGDASEWRPIKNLYVGRIDRPAIAASGSSVYIAYTDSVGGEVRVVKSSDAGATFGSAKAIGSTTGLSEGYAGFADIAVSGSTVVVAWQSGSGVLARVSTNGGSTWGGAVTMSSTPDRFLSVAAAGGRLAVAWSIPSMGGFTRVWKSGAWAPTRKFQAYTADDATPKGRELDVVLTGTSRIAVAYTYCLKQGCASSDGLDVRWRESNTNGQSWGTVRTVGSHTASAARRANEAPTALFASSTRRLVLWTTWSNSTPSETTYIKSGSGTP